MAPLNRPTVTSNRLQQALLRESLDFDSVSAYQTCIDSVVEQLNIPVSTNYSKSPHLQQLPTHRYLDYDPQCQSHLSQHHHGSLYSLHSAVAPDWSALDNLSLPRPFGICRDKTGGGVASDACA